LSGACATWRQSTAGINRNYDQSLSIIARVQYAGLVNFALPQRTISKAARRALPELNDSQDWRLPTCQLKASFQEMVRRAKTRIFTTSRIAPTRALRQIHRRLLRQGTRTGVQPGKHRVVGRRTSAKRISVDADSASRHPPMAGFSWSFHTGICRLQAIVDFVISVGYSCAGLDKKISPPGPASCPHFLRTRSCGLSPMHHWKSELAFPHSRVFVRA
jgi:hypothetical protein